MLKSNFFIGERDVFFKKLFSKKKEKTKEQEECWYNNSHEKIEKLSWAPKEEGHALCCSSVYISTSHAHEKPQ